VVLFCLGNQSLPLIDRDEPRFAEAAREMMQRVDRTVPAFQVAPPENPAPLVRWLEAVCAGLLGERLPRTDWIVPTFNGVARYDKPPLVYWLMALVHQLPGQTLWDPLGSWAAGLPSGLATVGLMLLLAEKASTWLRPAELKCAGSGKKTGRLQAKLLGHATCNSAAKTWPGASFIAISVIPKTNAFERLIFLVCAY
jgi:4-amino-4-deoxy-L-arabinose transferase-like glycosyltransferase